MERFKTISPLKYRQNEAECRTILEKAKDPGRCGIRRLSSIIQVRVSASENVRLQLCVAFLEYGDKVVGNLV